MSRTAASMSYIDVNLAVNGPWTDPVDGTVHSGKAANGEVVHLPAKTGTWSGQTLTITNNITLMGQSGPGNWGATKIIQTGTSGVGIKFITNSNTTDTAILGGFSIETPDGYSSNPIVIGGTSRYNRTDNNGGFRLTNIRWGNSGTTGAGSKKLYIQDWVTGVIDHCFYDCPADAAGTYWMEGDMPSQPGYVGSNTGVGSFVSVPITLTIASPGIVNWTNHPVKEGQGVMFTGTLPGGLTTNKVYFVLAPTTNAFKVSATPFTTAINFTGSASGVSIKACDNQPKQGYYSYSFPWKWGDDFNGIYIEDCIFQRNGFVISMADGPTATGGGGTRLVQRHCSSWGQFGSHGFDESGGNAGQGPAAEAYNNLYYSSRPAAAPKLHNTRSGAAVYFNERIIAFQSETYVLGYHSFYRGVAEGTHNSMIGPMDGTCFFDQNARGGLVTIETNLPTGQTFTPYETKVTQAQNLAVSFFTLNVDSTTGFPASGTIYVNTSANGTQPITYGSKTSNTFTCSAGTGFAGVDAAVVGPLVIKYTASGSPIAGGGTFAPVVTQIGSSSPGVPTDVRIGAVYANGTGATGNLNGGSAGLTGLTSPIADAFSGFTLRNATAGPAESTGAQTDGRTKIICSVIRTSTAGSNTTVTLSAFHENTTAGGLLAGENWELRFVVNGLGQTGGGGNIPLTDGGSPRCTFYETNSRGENKYWCDQVKDGTWFWDTKYCTTIARLSNSANVVPALFNYTTPGCFRLVQGGIHNEPRTIANAVGTAATVTADYPGPGVVANDTTHLRIGADWDSGTFGGVNSNGTIVATLASSIESGDTRAYWRATQAYGSTYPHPLVSAPAPTPPTIYSDPSTIWVAGIANSFSVTATGTTPITFTMPTPGTGGVPSWLSLSSDGSLSATTPVAGTYDFTITATSAVSPADTQAFRLTVSGVNIAPHCSITYPTNGAVFLTSDSIGITASAVDDDGSITQVQFFVDGVSIGTGTLLNRAYVSSSTSFLQGTHALTAKATDNSSAVTTSASISITVNPAVVPPGPPTMIVISG